MHSISAKQIRMARANLGWSQEQLAEKTGLSIATIGNLEMGNISPRGKTMSVLLHTFGDAGLEFIEPDGLRQRLEDVKGYHGPDSCEQFFEDMLQTVKGKGGEILFHVKTQVMFAQACGINNRAHLNRLKQLNDMAAVKCLFTDTSALSFYIPELQFKTISKMVGGPLYYSIYGDKFAIITPEGGAAYKFTVMQAASASQLHRDYFHAIWDGAAPFIMRAESYEQATTG
jgi:transcriptional regulator with XRE-family HTH domain